MSPCHSQASTGHRRPRRPRFLNSCSRPEIPGFHDENFIPYLCLSSNRYDGSWRGCPQRLKEWERGPQSSRKARTSTIQEGLDFSFGWCPRGKLLSHYFDSFHISATTSYQKLLLIGLKRFKILSSPKGQLRSFLICKSCKVHTIA